MNLKISTTKSRQLQVSNKQYLTLYLLHLMLQQENRRLLKAILCQLTNGIVGDIFEDLFHWKFQSEYERTISET